MPSLSVSPLPPPKALERMICPAASSSSPACHFSVGCLHACQPLLPPPGRTQKQFCFLGPLSKLSDVTSTSQLPTDSPFLHSSVQATPCHFFLSGFLTFLFSSPAPLMVSFIVSPLRKSLGCLSPQAQDWDYLSLDLACLSGEPRPGLCSDLQGKALWESLGVLQPQ